MRPILFCWRGRNIYSYPALLYLGTVAGLMAGNYLAHVSGLNPLGVLLTMLWLLLPALLGARLLFVSTHWETYRREPRRIWQRSEGGMSVYGGLLALPATIPLLAILQLPFGAFWDIAAICLLLGMSLGRVGCLLNGCCGGRPSESRAALYLPDQDGVRQRRIPTQILEMGWLLLLLCGAVLFWRRIAFPGGLFLSALAGYSLGRLFLDRMREQQTRSGPASVNQLISVLILLTSAMLFIARRY